MLSGRYRTERLCRFWSSNPDGICLLPSCREVSNVEDLTHILLNCQSLAYTRVKLCQMFSEFASKNLLVFFIVNHFLTSSDTTYQTQFLLDCSVLPDVILLRQTHGQEILNLLFYLTRTWCFCLHRECLRRLNRWR